MPLRAALFDFGGTILDMASDDEAHRRAFDWAAREWRLPVGGDELWRQHMAFMDPFWRGQPERWRPLRDLTRESFDRLLGRYRKSPSEESWGRFWDAYLDAHRHVIRAYPEASESLDRIRALGVHLGVVSDVDIDFLDLALGELGLRDRFDSATTSEEAGVGKPNPLLFQLALQKAGAPPEETAFVGDSEARDIRGAKSVGMRAVHVLRSGTPAPDADRIAKDLREVVAVIEEWMG